MRREHSAVAGLSQPAVPHHRAFPAGGTPGEFADFMRAELVKWGKIAKESGVRVESRFY